MKVLLGNRRVMRAAVHFRPVRGTSQSHLIAAEDTNLYVVKFFDNPQHDKLLPNEWLGSHLANLLGLPVPVPGIIEVTEEFSRRSPGLSYSKGGNSVPYRPGLQFGSTWAGGLLPSKAAFEYLPFSMMHQICNVEDMLGFLVFDKWVCNADSRQFVFLRERGGYKAIGIDYGECFGSLSWELQDCSLRGLSPYRSIYAGLKGTGCLEQWLSRLDALDEGCIWDGFASMPESWYWKHKSSAAQLVESLNERRKGMRELLECLGSQVANIFTSWGSC